MLHFHFYFRFLMHSMQSRHIGIIIGYYSILLKTFMEKLLKVWVHLEPIQIDFDI